MENGAYDLIIIGGGAGGVAAAIRARQLGARTLLLERQDLGGICLNRGCIPTKTLTEIARLYRSVHQADSFGLKARNVEIDWDILLNKKDELIQYIRLGTESLLKSNGVEILRKEASFGTAHRILVGNRDIDAKCFILATGSIWSPPSIEGIQQDGVINPDDVLSMKGSLNTIGVLGSGPIELELAQYLSFLGAKVMLFEEADRILAEEDKEVSQRMALVLRDQGLEILRQTRLLEIQHEKDSSLLLRLSSKNGESSVKVDRLLHAKRTPCMEMLGLQELGIKSTKGGILINDSLQTSIPHIYAIGDVTGSPMYSHRASAMGIVAAERALGTKASIDLRVVPRGYYTTPEIASVGMTEQEAIQAGYNCKVGTISYGGNPKAMILQSQRGSVKVVADSKCGQILGVHIVGPHATELIGEGALAVKMEATVEDLAGSIRYHPSFSESQVDAAREVFGRAIYVMR